MNNPELMQKVAEVAPDKYQYILKTAAEIKDSPFRDEILDRMNYLMEKAATLGARWDQFAKNSPMAAKALGAVGGGAAGVAGAALAGIAYSLAGDMYESAKRGLTKSRDFKSMLQENPDLKSLPSKSVQRAFSVLHRFNPEFASDPVVAGSFVRRSATFGDDGMAGDTKMLGELIQSRKNLGDMKKIPQVPDWKGQRLKHRDMEFDLDQKMDPDSQRNVSEREKIDQARSSQDKTKWDMARGNDQDRERGIGNAMDEFQRLMGRRPAGGFRHEEKGGRR